MKKLLKISGIALGVILLAAILLPILFKDKIIARVKSEINQNLYAVVDFEDIDISVFRKFPRLGLSLENISIVGKNEFQKDTLLSAPSIDVAVNLFSLFSDDMHIYKVAVESPRIHALVNKEGRANWDLAIPDTVISEIPTDTSSSSFKLKLNSYSISNGYIYYEDQTMNMKAEIIGLDHEGQGDFTEDEFTLTTETESASASFEYEGIPYLLNTKATITSDFLINNIESKYSFKGADILLNKLRITSDGFFQLVNDSTYNMDINFNAPSTDFKELLSLVPAVYKTDFDKLKTEGKTTFKGFVKGIYSNTGIPAYDVTMGVEDGFFQYPDLPKPIKNIQVDLRAYNPDGIPDHAVVDISKAHLEMGSDALDFKMLFKNPETAQFIDASLKGKMDLSQITQIIKLEGMRLGGSLAADVFARGNLSTLKNQSGPFFAGGFLQLQELFYSSKDFAQPIQHGHMRIDFTNSGGQADATAINISTAHLEIGSDPLDFSLQLKKPMTSVEFSGTARGQFTLDNVKQFVALEKGTLLTGILGWDMKFSGSKAIIDKGAYDQISTSGTAYLKNTKYISKDYPTGITISNTELSLNNSSIQLNNLEGNYLHSNFTAFGFVRNINGYAFKNESMKGELNVIIDQMNLNQWMGDEPEFVAATPADTIKSNTASVPFAVPANIDFTMKAHVGKVNFDKVDYKNIKGTVIIVNETVRLDDIQTEALDGTIGLNGSYSTRNDKLQPDISMHYNIKDVDVQKAFLAYNSMQKLMPAAEFISGKLSSQMSVKGKLNGDLMPDLGSLTGNGNLLLLEGVLKKFAPLEKIASSLNIADLNEVSLKDVKSFVEFSNGKVLVKPFKVKVKDIDMEIGGMHGFDQSLAYIIQMKVPRSYMGTQGNNLVDNLAAKAGSQGIRITPGETVNLSLKMAGTLTNPTVQTELKEAAGDVGKELKAQAVDFAKQKADTAKQTLKDSANAIRKQVTADLKSELKNQIFPSDSAGKGFNLDSSKKKTTETLKNTFGKMLKKKGR